MPIANPVTIDLQTAINDELVESARREASAVGTLLKDLFDELIRLQHVSEGIDPFAWDMVDLNGLFFKVKGGRFHTMKGNIVSNVGINIALYDSVLNYVQYQPGFDITVSDVEFVPGNIPLYTVDAGATSFGAADLTDKRPLQLLMNGKVVADAELSNALADAMPTMTMAVGAEAADQITVTIALKDSQGFSLLEKLDLEIWVASAVNGWEAAAAPSAGITVTTGTLLETMTASKRIRVKSNASGIAAIRLGEAGVGTWYLGVTLDDGKVYYSGAITFA